MLTHKAVKNIHKDEKRKIRLYIAQIKTNVNLTVLIIKNRRYSVKFDIMR